MTPPSVVACLAARHHQPQPRLELEMSESAKRDPKVWLLPAGQVAIRDGEDSWWVNEPEGRDHAIFELPDDAVRLARTANVAPVPDRDQHFTNPPTGGLHLDCDQLASLKVLLDFAVPREPGSPADWEGTGRRYHESILGYRAPCICPHPRLATNPPAVGCPVHDPTGDPGGTETFGWLDGSPVLPSGGQP